MKKTYRAFSGREKKLKYVYGTYPMIQIYCTFANSNTGIRFCSIPVCLLFYFFRSSLVSQHCPGSENTVISTGELASCELLALDWQPPVVEDMLGLKERLNHGLQTSEYLSGLVLQKKTIRRLPLPLGRDRTNWRAYICSLFYTNFSRCLIFQKLNVKFSWLLFVTNVFPASIEADFEIFFWYAKTKIVSIWQYQYLWRLRWNERSN
jgi:hypothetical protein